MRTELPAGRLRRRLESQPDSHPGGGDSGGGDDAESDPNSLLPSWQPDASADDGWLAKVRADPGRSGAVALATIAAVAVLITVFTVVRDRPEPVMSAKLPAVEMVSVPTSTTAPTAGPSAAPGADQPVVVSVVGLVHKPGLVTLAGGARVADALGAAGGVLDGADTTGLNMARPLGDGEQIVVGIAAPSGQPTVLGSSVSGGPTGSGTAVPGPAVAAESATTESAAPVAGPINLNTATAEQLDALPGVGPVTATAIVAWRTAHGAFRSVDDLAQVDGVGPARLERLRPLVRV